MVQCAGRPVILTLGRAVFVGAHLLVPSKRDRLLQVLQQTYGDDVLVGSKRAWVETPGVPTDWRPSQQTNDLFRDAGLFGRSRATATTPKVSPDPNSSLNRRSVAGARNGRHAHGAAVSK